MDVDARCYVQEEGCNVTYEVPVYCVHGKKKMLFFAQIDEVAGTVNFVYKDKNIPIGEVSLEEVIIQILKSRVYILHEK